jgi:hypothetical protein
VKITTFHHFSVLDHHFIPLSYRTQHWLEQGISFLKERRSPIIQLQGNFLEKIKSTFHKKSAPEKKYKLVLSVNKKAAASLRGLLASVGPSTRYGPKSRGVKPKMMDTYVEG